VVLAADSERTGLLAEAETAEDPRRIAEIHNRLADIGAHSAPARAATILAGLGFDNDVQANSVGSLSGGWRMRVALAAALFSVPDLLLLDEPTNHLDLEAAMWLERYLAGYDGSLIVASHDRSLLNTAVDAILHLEAQKLTLYSGGYDRFEQVRRERAMHQERLRKRQEADRKHIQAFVDRFRAQANKARQAQSRLKMLARMQPIMPALHEEVPRFDFPTPTPLAPPMLTLDNASVGYAPGKPVLRGLGLRIDMEDRIGLLGRNGNGKSTLLKLFAGRLDCESGRVSRARKLRVGYFAQDHLETLPLDRTAFQYMVPLLPDRLEPAVRAHLGRFGFAQEKADVLVSDLSGGERTRLALAGLCCDSPQLLLLDEPTNHLDIDSREALLHAINAFEGAVILVTHDPHVLSLTVDRLWLVNDGTCRPFDGDIADYTKFIASERRDGRARAANGGNGRPSRQDQRRQRAEARAAKADLRRAAKDAEKALEKLTGEQERIDGELADPALYDGPPERIAKLTRRKAEVAREIAVAEENWMAASEALEEDSEGRA
jgi:ATP-binding cassette subfamily F protein 3